MASLLNPLLADKNGNKVVTMLSLYHQDDAFSVSCIFYILVAATGRARSSVAKKQRKSASIRVKKLQKNSKKP
jgi:hypothetical protein